MNGAKICQQKIWKPRNYQMTSHFGKCRHIVIVTSNCHNPNTRSTAMVRTLHSSDIHSLVQLEYFELITKLNERLSNFEFVKTPVESSRSVCSML